MDGSKALLNIAVAEWIYHWKYIGEGHRHAENWSVGPGSRGLKRWSENYEDALELFEDMRDLYDLKGTIEIPWRLGGCWIANLDRFDGTKKYSAFGLTLEEAIVRVCLRAFGVEVE